jgi:hypothetical protein
MPCCPIFIDLFMFTSILLNVMVSQVLISIHYCTIHHSIQKTPWIQYDYDVIFIYYVVSPWLPLELMDLLFLSCCHFMMMVMWVTWNLILEPIIVSNTKKPSFSKVIVNTISLVHHAIIVMSTLCLIESQMAHHVPRPILVVCFHHPL